MHNREWVDREAVLHTAFEVPGSIADGGLVAEQGGVDVALNEIRATSTPEEPGGHEGASVIVPL